MKRAVGDLAVSFEEIFYCAIVSLHIDRSELEPSQTCLQELMVNFSGILINSH